MVNLLKLCSPVAVLVEFQAIAIQLRQDEGGVDDEFAVREVEAAASEH